MIGQLLGPLRLADSFDEEKKIPEDRRILIGCRALVREPEDSMTGSFVVVDLGTGC